jgi:hypothetical protein
MKFVINYEQIKVYTKEELKIIQEDDIKNNVPGANVTYQKPLYGCKLYRVKYSSKIPEKKKTTIAYGVIAIPDIDNKNLPILSYQHGTVVGQYDVPSFIDNSFETRLVLAQFAGMGYIVIAADYFGLGLSKELDSYIVLDSQSQACLDLYYASLEILQEKQINKTDFYVSGWSQGGIVTLAFLEKLNNNNILVKAAGTAACQNDGFSLVNQILFFPREIDALWLPVAFILTVFSFQEYYSKCCLAKNLFLPTKYDLVKKIYLKDPTLKPEDYPTNVKDIIRPEYLDLTYFRNSRYGKIINTVAPYRWVINTPLNMHYGEIDESVTALTCQLCANFQKGIGNNKVNAISEGPDADHRRTFARSIPKWRLFFDSIN